MCHMEVNASFGKNFPISLRTSQYFLLYSCACFIALVCVSFKWVNLHLVWYFISMAFLINTISKGSEIGRYLVKTSSLIDELSSFKPLVSMLLVHPERTQEGRAREFLVSSFQQYFTRSLVWIWEPGFVVGNFSFQYRSWHFVSFACFNFWRSSWKSHVHSTFPDVIWGC